MSRSVRSSLLVLLTLAAGGLSVRGAGAGPAYYEETDPAVTWTGAWSTNRLAANSGGSARLAMDAGATASFVFSGTAVSWIGYRDQWCGVANVSLDGVLQAMVDTSSTPARAEATLYAIDGLASGTHTLVVQATGTHGAGSAGSWVWVDGFSVGEQPALAPEPPLLFLPSRPFPASVGRVLEQDAPAVTWIGTWSTNHLAAHSGGSAELAMEASSRATLTFVGTGASWIGYRDEWSGIADVLLDGRLQAAVDTYATPSSAQVPLFTIEGLPSGAHTLTIQPTGRHGPASGGSWIWVDGFSITR